MHSNPIPAVLTLAVATTCLLVPPLGQALAQIAGAPETPATLGTVFGVDLEKAFAWATAIVAAASLLANVTTTDTDNKILATIRKALDFFALNFRK